MDSTRQSDASRGGRRGAGRVDPSSSPMANKVCLWCAFSSSRLSDLLTHMKGAHPSEYAANDEVDIRINGQNSKRYKCFRCNAAFSRTGNLMDHVNKYHHSELPLVSTTTSETYSASLSPSGSVTSGSATSGSTATSGTTGNSQPPPLNNQPPPLNNQPPSLNNSEKPTASANEPAEPASAENPVEPPTSANNQAELTAAADSQVGQSITAVNCVPPIPAENPGLSTSGNNSARPFANGKRAAKRPRKPLDLQAERTANLNALLSTAAAVGVSSLTKVSNSVAARGAHICPYCKINCQSRKHLMSHLDEAHRDCDSEDEAFEFTPPPVKRTPLPATPPPSAPKKISGAAAVFLNTDQVLPDLTAEASRKIQKLAANNAMIQRLLSVIEEDDNMSRQNNTYGLARPDDASATPGPSGTMVRDKKFKCFWCEQVFRKRGKLMDHIDEVHKHSRDQNELEAEILQWNGDKEGGVHNLKGLVYSTGNIIVPPTSATNSRDSRNAPYYYPTKVCKFELKSPTYRRRGFNRGVRVIGKRVCKFYTDVEPNPLNNRPSSDRVTPVFRPPPTPTTVAQPQAPEQRMEQISMPGLSPFLPASLVNMLYTQHAAAQAQQRVQLVRHAFGASVPQSAAPSYYPTFPTREMPSSLLPSGFYRPHPTPPPQQENLIQPPRQVQVPHYIDSPLDLSGPKRRKD